MNTETIKELREETGLSLSEIKKSFRRFCWRQGKALEILSLKAKEVAAKKEIEN